MQQTIEIKNLVDMEACFPWLGADSLKPVLNILQKHGFAKVTCEQDGLVSYGTHCPLLTHAWFDMNGSVRFTLLKLLFSRLDRDLWRKFRLWKKQGRPILFPNPRKQFDLIAIQRETMQWDRPTRLLLLVILAAHHDGFVREVALEKLLQYDTPPALAALLQGIGGYVTTVAIPLSERCLYRNEWAVWQRFARENPVLFRRTRDRMISFWNLKRRREYPRLRDYPPYRFFQAIRMHQEPHHGR